MSKRSFPSLECFECIPGRRESVCKTRELTDGNLGAHLHKLEESGYLTITKTFVRNKPQTYIEITEVGRQAFAEHRAALREILESNFQFDNNGARDTSKGDIN